MNFIKWLTAVAVLFLFFGINSIESQSEPVCEIRTIEYEVVELTIDDPDVDIDELSELSFPGQKGKSEYCENTKTGEIISVKVLKESVDEVVYSYSQVAEEIILQRELNAQQYYYDDVQKPVNQGGAMCNDGTRSFSTGRGTCSWHGGVSYWL